MLIKEKIQFIAFKSFCEAFILIIILYRFILFCSQMTPFIGKSNVVKEQISVIRSGIERLSSTTNLLLVSIFL